MQRSSLVPFLLLVGACEPASGRADAGRVADSGPAVDAVAAPDADRTDAALPDCVPELSGALVGMTPGGTIDLPVVSAEALGGCWSTYPFDVVVIAEAATDQVRLSFTVEGAAADRFEGTTTAWINGESHDAPMEVEIREAEPDGWEDGVLRDSFALDVSLAVKGGGWDLVETEIEGRYCHFSRTLCAGVPDPGGYGRTETSSKRMTSGPR